MRIKNSELNAKTVSPKEIQIIINKQFKEGDIIHFSRPRKKIVNCIATYKNSYNNFFTISRNVNNSYNELITITYNELFTGETIVQEITDLIS